MYTIVVTDDNELVKTVEERIMCKSKLVDTLHFLVNPIYKEQDMSKYSVVMEYVLPVSKEYKTEYLVLSSELYKDMLEYKVPFDSNLTKEPGDLSVQLTFVYVEMQADSNTVQHVRKTSPCVIKIIPISAWSDIISDSALTALDQKIVQINSQINAMEDLNKTLSEEKADNIKIDGTTIYLTANGEEIGDRINIGQITSKSMPVLQTDNQELNDDNRTLFN